MTGSSLIPIVTPIVALLAMALWLGMIFYANSHPGRRSTTSPTAPGDVPATPARNAQPPRIEHEELPPPGAAADLEPVSLGR